MPPRRVPTFSEPPGGWRSWNSNSLDGVFLKTLIRGGSVNGMTALDIQEQYAPFQLYKPANFSKNIQRLRESAAMHDPNQFAATIDRSSPGLGATDHDLFAQGPGNFVPLNPPPNYGQAFGGPTPSAFLPAPGVLRNDAPASTGGDIWSSNPPIAPGIQYMWLPTFIDR